MKYIKINEKDNVAIVVCAPNGETHIPNGHKIALRDIAEGENVIKYGHSIGVATKQIVKGDHVHVHNLKSTIDGKETFDYKKERNPLIKKENTQYFSGYSRRVGLAGTRNEIWILPTVGCVSGVAEKIASLAVRKILPKKNIDAIRCFKHSYGCSQLSDDRDRTEKILGDLAIHPNVGGALIVGLGCENSGIEKIKEQIPAEYLYKVRFIKLQDCVDELEEGLGYVRELAIQADSCTRSLIPVNELTIGLKCGGSDGYSGLTANPLIGVCTDKHVSTGGRAILTEIPEMFGAEEILLKRCDLRETFDKVMKTLYEFKQYYISHGEKPYENPSPGNKEGGITTLEEKSLGCIKKGGTSSIVDVLDYGQRISKSGLNILSAPGNDLVSTTALAASGAQIICFSTGRGTPFGGPVPTIKISSNTDLKNRRGNWIDYDAGSLIKLDKEKYRDSLDASGDELYSLILEVASGRRTLAERNEYADIAIWKTGVTL